MMAEEKWVKTEQRHVVAKVDELSEGSRKLVYLAGREIGVFHVAGHYYALRNVCPHKGAPICKGRIRPQIYPTRVGEVAFTMKTDQFPLSSPTKWVL